MPHRLNLHVPNQLDIKGSTVRQFENNNPMMQHRLDTIIEAMWTQSRRKPQKP